MLLGPSRCLLSYMTYLADFGCLLLLQHSEVQQTLGAFYGRDSLLLDTLSVCKNELMKGLEENLPICSLIYLPVNDSAWEGTGP